ncbi:hypothetical protein GW796_10615 [archaeon]|nr:hypothetical protein [archaeon]
MSEKLNLNKSAVDFYWKTQDQRMLKILSMMEAVEPWVVDDVESVAKELVSFGKKISLAKTGQLSQNSDDVTLVMTYIFSGKALRMLNWLDDNYPGLSFHYVMEARQREDWEAGRLLLDRLKTIKTLSLLGMIFTPMRTRLISGLLDDDDDDDDEVED